jgi:hypothetical protein
MGWTNIAVFRGKGESAWGIGIVPFPERNQGEGMKIEGNFE